jgi:hypothetical protein
MDVGMFFFIKKCDAMYYNGWLLLEIVLFGEQQT